MLSQSPDYPSYVSHLVAKQATLRALLNSYLRETGRFDPRDSNLVLERSLLDAGEPMSIPLTHAGGTVISTMTYFSTLGQHQYGKTFYLCSAQGQVAPLDMHDIIQCLLEELSLRQTGQTHDIPIRDMREKICNSFTRIASYIDIFRGDHPDDSPPALDFISAEQSLLLGHPFHPFPKSLAAAERRSFVGFSPEARACFQLNYLAVHRQLLVEEWLGPCENAIAEVVHQAAEKQLGNTYSQHAILPMHPWQANYLLQQPDVEELLARKLIVDLGALGPMAYPTSSVRSVWLPEIGYGYKLSLQVRITNLVRENTHEQSRRTLDAARVIDALGGQVTNEHFSVILETGYQTLCADHAQVARHRCPGFTVIYRPMSIDEQCTFVMASLLETYPGHNEPKLISAICQSNDGQMIDPYDWFRAYLNISMLTVLDVLARTGVSFEAHLQNTKVTLVNGWPTIFHVRDLEGVSLDCSRIEDSGWLRDLGIGPDSPLLYSPQETWRRTQYYFFVNHLGGLVHALAAYAGTDEGPFWRLTAQVLQRERADADVALRGYIDALLTDRYWPAKANLTSCFQQRGATPLFVDVINPLKAMV